MYVKFVSHPTVKDTKILLFIILILHQAIYYQMLPPYLVLMHMKSQDFGWMYHRGFEDINGHIWEIVYMDESSIPK